jgi:hypothetical protein
VPDPEIPVLTIADLGVLREVTVDERGHVEVTITPTYSGCPAMDAIRADIVEVLAAHGHPAAALGLPRAAGGGAGAAHRGLDRDHLRGAAGAAG